MTSTTTRPDRLVPASTAHLPGFCARCDGPTLVGLGAGAESIDALCPTCRSAERQDRASHGRAHR